MKTLPVKLRVPGIRAEGVPYIPLPSVSSHGELNPHRREPPWAGVWFCLLWLWACGIRSQPNVGSQEHRGNRNRQPGHTHVETGSAGHTQDTDKNAKRIHKRANTDELNNRPNIPVARSRGGALYLARRCSGCAHQRTHRTRLPCGVTTAPEVSCVDDVASCHRRVRVQPRGGERLELPINAVVRHRQE